MWFRAYRARFSVTLLSALLFLLSTRPSNGVQPLEDCCEALFTYGFSLERVSSPVPFEGLLGQDSTSGLCGEDAETVVEVPEGQVGEATVFLNLVSNSDFGADGWSLSLAIDNAAPLACGDYTTTGTAAALEPDGLREATSGFERTCAAGPEANEAQTGMVSAVVLSQRQGTTLPVIGTESIVKLTVRSGEPQGIDDQVVHIRFHDRLVATECRPPDEKTECFSASQPVASFVTMRGVSFFACNPQASLRLIFRRQTGVSFLRGDCDGDGRLAGVSDAVRNFRYCFSSASVPCLAACDADGDGNACSGVTDGLRILMYLFRDGEPLPVPFPLCGTSSRPTDALLGCADSGCL